MSEVKDPLAEPATFEENDYWNANAAQPSDESSPAPNGTKLSDLPEKCLVNIFKWIPFQSLDNIIEFSPRWKKLVQEHIPLEAHLTDIGFRIAKHYFIDHKELPEYRIKVIHSRVLDEPLPNLKAPEDLEVLDFATHTELVTYKHLIGNAENLKELYFNFSSLLGDVLGEVDIHLPKLTVLYMADRAVEGKWKDPEKCSILPRNINGFLGKTFPSIKKLVVYTEATRKQTMEYSKELLKFIQRNGKSLKVIKFTVATPIFRIMEDRQAGQDQINDLVEFSSVEGEEFNLEELKNVRLTEVDVSFGKDFFSGLEQWRWILQHQNELQHLTIGMEKPLDPKIFEAPVTLSASSLVSVQIGVNVSRDEPLDCSIFEKCVNLKMLALTGPPMKLATEEGDRPPAKELQNFAKLPPGLQALAIENIYLETKQIAEVTRGIMRKLRKVHRLSLQNIGTVPGFGVSLAMLDCWLTSQAMEEIIVKRGMNGEETRLHEYEHLMKFGVTSPIAKCSVHAFYYPNFMEYRKPADYVPRQEQKKDMPFSFM